MDAQTLSAAMGGSLPLSRYEALLPAYNAAMREAGITSVNRSAMFAAQLGHESVGLKFLTEIWGPTSDQRTYEGRRDLGNTVAGDGYRFRGRGAIMITGRFNYTNLSRWAHGQNLVPSPTFFVDQPDQLSGDKYYMTGAIWYWTVARPQLNALSDARNMDAATRAINGGLNGITDRRNRYQTCLRLGDKLLPTKGGFLMALSDKEQRELLDKVRYVADQLGPKHPLWPDTSSVGKDAEGRELTLRDGFAAYLRGKKETDG